jgi:hypothetical protein
LKKNETNAQKKRKNKKQISKIKKHKSKIKGEQKGKKRKVKKGLNMWKTWSCPFAVFLHLFCFLDLLFFCFYFAFILLSAWKKAKQMQNKSKQNSKSKKQNN